MYHRICFDKVLTPWNERNVRRPQIKPNHHHSCIDSSGHNTNSTHHQVDGEFSKPFDFFVFIYFTGLSTKMWFPPSHFTGNINMNKIILKYKKILLKKYVYNLIQTG